MRGVGGAVGVRESARILQRIVSRQFEKVRAGFLMAPLFAAVLGFSQLSNDEIKMTLNKSDIVAAIKAEVLRIASDLDLDASDLQSDEILPASGLIDSAGLLELIAWFEQAYAIRIPSEDFTIDKLGSLDLMADYLLSRKAQG